MKRAIFPVLILMMALPCRAASPEGHVRDGDIIFQSSLSSQGEAIQRATRSPYSHVGIILFDDGKPFVFEAGSTVGFTPLRTWVARGSGGHFVVRRLRNAGRGLDRTAIGKIRAQARLFEGTPYDLAFGWSDERIYCSELVWKIYDRALGIRIGRLRKLKDFDLADPLVAEKLRERYGQSVPLEEPVISPADLFRSKLLVTVTQR